MYSFTNNKTKIFHLLYFFLSQEWSKGKWCKAITLNHKNWILYKHPHPFCAVIVTDKLRVNYKMKTKQFLCMLSRFIGWNIKE